MAEAMSKVEFVARAMATAAGNDPDELRPATGYRDAPLVPYWHLYREWAVSHIAAHDALNSLISKEA